MYINVYKVYKLVGRGHRKKRSDQVLWQQAHLDTTSRQPNQPRPHNVDLRKRPEHTNRQAGGVSRNVFLITALKGHGQQ